MARRGVTVSQSSIRGGQPPADFADPPDESRLAAVRRFLADNRHGAGILLGLILVGFVTAAAVGLLKWRDAERDDSATRISERAELAAGQVEGLLANATPALGVALARIVAADGELSSQRRAGGREWALDLAGFVDSAIAQIPLSPSSRAALLAPDGTPLTSSGFDGAAGELLARAGRNASAGTVELDGSTQLYSTAPVAGSPWTVVLAAPEDEVVGAAGGFAGWVLWAILAEVALVGLLGILLLMRVLRGAEEVDRANAELSQRSTVAEHATEAKNGFISTMAHEMRTPLAAVAMFAEMMRTDERDPLPPSQRRRAVDIASSTRHVLDLLDDSMDLSRVESGRLELRPEPVSVAAIAIEVVDGMHPLALDRGIELSLEADGKLGEVFLDPARVRQVMINFLSNALKFTPSGGRVRMRVGRNGESSLLIEVEDTGIGIEADSIARIFDSVHVTTTPLHSQDATTGLGLAVTKRLVEAMGGTVGVRSRAGDGSTFTASLPRVGVERRGVLGVPRVAEQIS